MEQHGDAATETTSVLLTKTSLTAPCLRHRALHHCGDLDQFRTTEQTSVDFLNHQAPTDIGRCACMVLFSIPRKNFRPASNRSKLHHETWLHLDFVDWRNSQSHHEEPDRRILLKERPAPHHQGQQKRRFSDVMSDHSLSS